METTKLESEANKIAEQIVANNDKILQRLDSSANVLMSQNGKELPAQRLNSQELDELIASHKVVDDVAEPNNITSADLSIEASISSEQLKDIQVKAPLTQDELKWSEDTVPLSQQTISSVKNDENKTIVNSSDTQKEETLLSETPLNSIQTHIQESAIKEGSEKQVSGRSTGEKMRSDSFNEIKEIPFNGEMGDDEWLNQIQASENSGLKREELLLKQEHLAQNQAIKRLSSNALNQATQQQATIVQAHGSQPLSQTLIQDSFNTGQLQPMMNANPAMLPEKAFLGTAMVGRAITEEKQQGNEASVSLAQQVSQGSHQLSGSQVSLQRTDPVNSANIQLTRDFAGEQVAEKVQMMMSKNLKNIDIRLDPPELGRLQIRMQVTGEGTSVHFTVSNPQARDAIEHTMPRLREMLAQQGVQLGESSVQQQASGQQRSQYGERAQGTDSGQSSNTSLTGDDLETDVGLELNILGKRDGISYYA
jgi:flagellar hook-length control protein FliK